MDRPAKDPKKMKIGYALGGGGAKGFAHIGVLNTLQKAGICADVVAGTSVGALVGAVYSAGTLDKLASRALEFTLTDIPTLLSPAWSLRGLFSGKNAFEMLSELLEPLTIEELPLPFAAVSADLHSTKSIIHSSGDLRQALRASISIPAVFTPISFQEYLLVDGGLLEPLPVQCTRELLGADFVIAIDLFGHPGDANPLERKRLVEDLFPAGLMNALSYLRSLSSKLPWGNLLGAERERQPHIIDIIELTLCAAQRQLTEFRLREYPPDVLIQPSVHDVGLLDFHRGEPIIERGVRIAEAMLPEILRRIDEAQGAFAKRQSGTEPGPA